MKSYAPKIGAIFYILWGLLHIVGAAALFQQISVGGTTAVLAAIGSAMPRSELPQISGGVTAAVVVYHVWNLLWVGFFVLVVGLRLNWKNSPLGYWLNMAVVGAIDLGLLVTLLLPGYMALSDGIWGLVLWFFAALFSTLGLLSNNSRRASQAALT